MALTQPLQLDYWLINVFSGNEEIFSIVGLIFITFMCARFKMPLGVTFGMITIFSAILYSIFGFEALIVGMAMIGGYLFFTWLAKSQS